jgi:hypothetical protein
MYCGLCFQFAINSDVPTLDNLQDLQEEDFELFKQQGKSILDQ